MAIHEITTFRSNVGSARQLVGGYHVWLDMFCGYRPAAGSVADGGSKTLESGNHAPQQGRKWERTLQKINLADSLRG